MKILEVQLKAVERKHRGSERAKKAGKGTRGSDEGEGEGLGGEGWTACIIWTLARQVGRRLESRRDTHTKSAAS